MMTMLAKRFASAQGEKIMKKLLVAVGAAACALGAFAAVPNGAISGTDFENYTLGQTDITSPLFLEGETEGAQKHYWVTNSLYEVVVTNDAAWTGGKFLRIDSVSDVLYRTLTGFTDSNQTTIPAGQQIETGLYIDTQVQFTAADSDMTVEEEGAKLAVWVRASDTNDDEETDTTNFVVKAGFYDENGDFTNKVYTMANPEGVTFASGEWVRLTVKSLSNIDGNGNVGFVVFVNGKELTTTETTGLENLTVVAQQWATKNALLPSMIVSGDRKTELAAVGFSGSGAVDDIAFTTVAPTFAADAAMFSVEWGTDLTVTCTGIDSLESGKNYMVPGEEVTLTAVAGDGLYVKWVKNDEVVARAATYTFTPAANDRIVASTYTPVAKIGDVYYESIEAALANATGDIVLTADVTVANSGVINLVTGEYVIDLAGKTLSCNAIGLGNTVSLEIKNSTSKLGSLKVGAPIQFTPGATEGSLKIRGGKIDAIILPITGNVNSVQIYGGTFFVDEYESDGFYLKDYIVDAENTDVTYSEPYVTVAPKGGTQTPTLEPGVPSQTYDTLEAANAAAAQLTVAVPAGVTGVDAEIYKGYFVAKVTGTESGYVVTFDLNDEMKTQVQTSADTAVKTVDLKKVAEGNQVVEFDAVNGLFYSVAASEDLASIDAPESEGDRVLPNGGKVTLTFPKKGNKKGFYKVKVNFTNKSAE
jgi:hypothetical protein